MSKNAAWKQTERAIAKRLGGRRTGPTGRSGPDILTDWLAVEVKYRRKLPQWLTDAVEQAQTGTDDRLAVVILHQAGSRHADDLIVLRLADFEEWFGQI